LSPSGVPTTPPLSPPSASLPEVRTSTTTPTPTDYESAPLSAAKSIGHTSVVFKLTFKDGRVAAFKPESKRGKLRYRSEAAAFRLSKPLSITNVPTALLVKLSRKDLSAALANDTSRALFADEVVDHDGLVRGALMPWVPHLSFVPFETEPARTRWRGWMKAGSTPSGPNAENAPELSALCVFDAVTGNWDRWSGANFGFDDDTKHLLFVDNDGAFFDPAPPGPYAEQLAILKSMERFPRATIASARALDLGALDTALGVDELGAPLLTASQRAAILKRRDDVLAVVDAKIKSLGDDAVLSF
jgi:hypothetical protein